jgi:hypothetical protein
LNVGVCRALPQPIGLINEEIFFSPQDRPQKNQLRP